MLCDSDKAALLIALAVAILLIVLLVASKSEMFEQGVGYPYAFGASSPLRGWGWYPQSGISHGAYNRKQQEFSMPRQGEYTTVSAMQVKAMEDMLKPSAANLEDLTGSRSAPDFWEVSEDLLKSQNLGITGKEHLESAPQGLLGGNTSFPWVDTDSYVYPGTY